MKENEERGGGIIQPLGSETAATSSDPRLADDLAARLVSAIDSWRKDYGMETLPDSIALRQAAGILRSMIQLQEIGSDGQEGRG